LKMVKDIKVDHSAVSCTIEVTPAYPRKQMIEESVQKAVSAVPGVSSVKLNFGLGISSGATDLKQNLIPQVKNSIAISSGKGGVGKTTVSVNLAVALAQAGAKVGLLDADIYGPNVPLMIGIHRQPELKEERIIPPENHGIKVMSIGFLVPDDTPIVWRGPMIHGAIQQFLKDVEWGELDYLLVDLPPGTGDAQLSIVQLVPLTGAVIVTTPQEVSLLDSKKGLSMFQKAHVPVLGIVENMSYFLCGKCGERTEIFDYGGGRKAAEKLAVPFLGEIPIDTAIRIGGDTGMPIVVSHQDSEQTEAIRNIAGEMAVRIRMANASKVKLTIIN
jgi:ATP-binding protein involved in chromosome partitioning